MRLPTTIFVLLLSAFLPAETHAQSLDSSNFRIEWQVANRFRLFRNMALFKLHENAWRQYLLHVDGLGLAPDSQPDFVARTSILGSEHVLNDRHIAFTNILRQNFDWRGWAYRAAGATCYDTEKRDYSACGGIESYLNPASHPVELWLAATGGLPLPADRRCEWRIGGKLVASAPCGQRVSGAGIDLPYPDGADISVNVAGEPSISVAATVKDLLIVGMGDSFASGEGNPDQPVEFDEVHRFRNLYPLRAPNDVSGSAQWTDQRCHRSLYGQQLRAALQVAVENPQAAVTYLDYSCSGAAVDEGILGDQTYIERQAGSDGQVKPEPLFGASHQSQLYRLLHDLCAEDPVERDGEWICSSGKYRRVIDLVFLSIGGNDIGFSNLVAWATLRDGVSSSVAALFGATVSAQDFATRMSDTLPGAYAHLAKALETALPVYSAGEKVFDPSRIVLTAYPDLVTGESGATCEGAAEDGDNEDRYPANQSLDMFSSWLAARAGRLAEVRTSISDLYREMRGLAGNHGWTFAGRAYADRMFEGHGFCAKDSGKAGDPAEVLMIPCWGQAARDTETCQSSWSGKISDWRPYNPAIQNFPYALRQRWVRTFNDAYLVINQKVVDRYGNIDEQASAGVFSETTGALHPTAEGHAVMADALMLSIRPIIAALLEDH